MCSHTCCAHLEIKHKVFWDFLWVCIIDDGNFPYWLGWWRINSNENRENIRELVTSFLCRLSCKTMPDKDFSDEVTHYQENLTTGLRHKCLLIKLYLTHKSNVQCSPVAWIKDLRSVLWVVSVPALRSPMPFAHSKKKAHIEPSSLYCCDKLCCHLPHEQAYWWLWDLEWEHQPP